MHRRAGTATTRDRDTGLHPRRRLSASALLVLAVVASFAQPLDATRLAQTLGRNAVLIDAAPYRPPLGATVKEAGLAERLERLGYQRVHQRPERAGEYFWGPIE